MNARGLVHHVAVGKDQSVRREHKSRAAALPLARLPGAATSCLRYINLDYRRTDLLRRRDYGIGVRIEQGRVIKRTGWLLNHGRLRASTSLRQKRNAVVLLHDC